MPEGPEVKVIADQLSKLLCQGSIISIKILSGKYCGKMKLLNYDEIIKNLPLKIQDVCVKGKMIYIVFEQGWYLFNSLGMSGTWTQKKVNHCHIEFDYLDQNGDMKQIWFFDIRRFGNMYFSNDPKYIQNKLDSIGYDMLSNPPTLHKFNELLRTKKNWNVCKILMDQSIISGCGNYIKSEVLYLAKISPLHKIDDLSDKNIEDLYKAIIYIINKSYESKGTTLSTYKHVDGSEGKFSNLLEVYNKKQTKNGYKIEKIKTPDGRSTFWVPNIQK